MVGAGLGGLSAAIHARLEGHDVLVLEKGAVGGKAAGIDISGYRLDPGPSIIILPEIYENVFKKAGRRMADYLEFIPLNPITRLYFGSEPLDIPAGIADCLEFLRSAAPEDVDAFAVLFEKLVHAAPLVEKSVFEHPYHHAYQVLDPNLIRMALPFDVRLTFKEIIDKTFKSPLLRAFFYGFPSYAGQSYRSKAPGALLVPFYMLQGGVFYPKGGVRAIPEAFAKLAFELGVEFRMSSQVERTVNVSDRVSHVELNTGERISGDHFILNRDRVQSETWMGRSLPVKASYSYFTTHWGVRRPLPEVKHHTLIVPEDFEQGFEQLYDERVFPNAPIVYLNNTSDLDPTAAPEGKTNLFSVVTSPAREDHFDWAVETERCVDDVVKVLGAKGIEVDRADVDFERIQNPIYFEKQHENFRGSLYGADEKFRLFGLFPWRNKDEVLKNVTYCGGSVQPGAGLPMVTLSGKFAVDSMPR